MSATWRVTQPELERAVADSVSLSDVLRRLGLRPAGGNFRTLRKHLDAWDISIEHFPPNVPRRMPVNTRKPLESVLVENSTYDRGSLKRRLYAEGLKGRVCEMCGQGESWNGRSMALILDHVNGVSDDNRLENLRILCPNCAATLDTHCAKNPPRGRPFPSRERECLWCGAQFRANRRSQRYCSQRCGTHAPSPGARPAMRRVPRPSYDDLIDAVDELGWCAVARAHGVSDNAVRKWVRAYERELAEGVESGS